MTFQEEIAQLAAEIAAEEHISTEQAIAQAVATMESLYAYALEFHEAALAQRSIPVQAA